MTWNGYIETTDSQFPLLIIFMAYYHIKSYEITGFTKKVFFYQALLEPP